MIRTLLVDDENLIRQTLQRYLDSEPNIEVVGTAENGKEAIALVKKLKPDIVLLDIEMPEMDSLTEIELLYQRFPQTKIIILSSHDDSTYLDKALRAGVKGYLLKSLSPEELSQSIKLVHQGYLQIAPGLSDKLSWLNKHDDNSLVVKQATTAESSLAVQDRKSDRSIIAYSYDSLPSDVNSLPLVEPEEFLPAVSRWTTRGGMILLGIFGTALFLTNVLKYKTTVKADVKIRPTGELRLVQAAIEGTVTSIQVKANQTVDRGDVIATIDASNWQTKQNQLKQKLNQNAAQLDQIKGQISQLDRQIAAQIQALDRELASAQADLALSKQDYQQQTATTQAELEAANATVKLAQEELARYQQLSETGAVSSLQISKKKASLQEALARQKQAQAAISPSAANITKAQEQIARQQAEGKAQISILNRDRKVLVEKQIGLEKETKSDRLELEQLQKNAEKTTIRASASGIVQQLNLRNSGQVVNPGEAIATIAPRDSDLIISAAVAPQDIGKVAIEQKVQIKVSACPYPDYGILTGAVATISPDAFEPESSTNNNSDRNNNSSYQVTIKPQNNFVGTQKRKCSIQSGMNGNADIITQQETVLSFLLRKARLKTGI